MNTQFNNDIRRHLFLDRTRRRIHAGTCLVCLIGFAALATIAHLAITN